MSLPERVPMTLAASYLGVAVRCLRGKYVRERLLPWPDPKTLTWARADVAALKAWLDSRRNGVAVPRPTHDNF